MLKKLLIVNFSICFLLVFANGFVFAQNVTDANNKKQGHWVITGKDRPSSGYGQQVKVEEGDYQDGRKAGTWTKYYDDGKTPKLKGTYVNNRPEGEYEKYYSNGTIKEKGSLKLNLNIDTLTRYHENGTIEYQAIYNAEGNENGTVKYYYSNGQLEFEYNATNGTPTGNATRYYENGDQKETILFSSSGEVTQSTQIAAKTPVVKTEVSNKPKDPAPKVSSPNTRGAIFLPNGYNKVYNDNNDIWQDGNFKNSMLWDGKVYEYDKDGILLKVKVYKNGTYHSDGQL
jgi:antitoxin component YwqK of YwqJK toxin-antitoxin module